MLLQVSLNVISDSLHFPLQSPVLSKESSAALNNRVHFTHFKNISLFPELRKFKHIFKANMQKYFTW